MTHAAILHFIYTNHRGETAARRVVNPLLFFGATEYYPETQWLMYAFDIDKDNSRTFAVKNIKEFIEGEPYAND